MTTLLRITIALFAVAVVVAVVVGLAVRIIARWTEAGWSW